MQGEGCRVQAEQLLIQPPSRTASNPESFGLGQGVGLGGKLGCGVYGVGRV